MTKRDFLILMIKLFGLYSIVTTLFSALPGNVIFAMGHFDFTIAVWILVVFVVTMGLFWLLTFKADRLVDLLKLEHGFVDDRIELGSIKPEDIIKIGTFVIGGLLFLRSIPGFLSGTFWAFKGDIAGLEFSEKDKFDLVVSGLNVMFGYLLFTNYDWVAKRLNGKREGK
jgi:hypothetical protein